MTKAFQLRYTSLNSKSLAVLNGYISVPFKHTPVPIKLTSCFIKKFLFILKNNCKNIFLKVQSQSQKKQNAKIKQQGIQVDQLYIHNEVSSKHIATSIQVHVQLSNTFKNQIKQTNKTFNSWGWTQKLASLWNLFLNGCQLI